MRRALCIGIDSYPFEPLRGCVSDAERISMILAKHEDSAPNFDCRCMLAPNVVGAADVVTRASTMREIEELFEYPADVAFLHFSGHGTVNNLDGYLVTQDAESYDAGVRMSDVLRLANQSKAAEVVIVLDCCHSGHLGTVPALNNQNAMLAEGVSILTASRGDQPSVEDSGGGLFTSLVADALEGGAADILGQVTAPAIYAYVEAALGAWDQRPLFKAHVTKVTPLRYCHAAIDRNTIRNLPTIFQLPAEELPLDPTFERQSCNPDPNNNCIFDQLQDLNRTHLVVPVNADHMYDAAMQSKSCKLTATGRYYWRLAESGRI